MAFHFHLLLGLAVFLSLQCSFGQECPNAETANDCESCISLGPGCAWCKYKYFEDFKTPRCGTQMSLRESGCSDKDIVDPESQHTVAEEGESLNPQRIKLELRPGKAHTFQVQMKLQRKQKPVDVYFLTSFSADNLGNQKRTLADKAIQGIARENQNAGVHIKGYGLFGNTIVTDSNQKKCEESGHVCKPELYVTHSSTTPHRPPHIQAWRTEGGLQALMQVALCQDVITWGQNDRLVVYATNGKYKLAPETMETESINSSICQMNNSVIHTTMRPPSLSELRKVLLENNIQVIFTVPDSIFDEYLVLVSQLPKTGYAIVDISEPHSIPFENAYERLRTSLVLYHLPQPGLNITYEPQCRHSIGGNFQGKCFLTGIERKKIQTFNVTVSSESCVLPASFEIKYFNSQDNLTVELTPRCNCKCDDQPDPEFCSYAGNPVCGKCRCDAGHFGESCECSISDDDRPCREKEGGPVCSGRGNCVCGQCECHRGSEDQRIFFGRYCECDNFSCPWSNGKICGGNGMCSCGRCVCEGDYVGDACQCSTRVDRCQSPNGMLCSGHGNCLCNQCVCMSVYTGALCDECPIC